MNRFEGWYFKHRAAETVALIPERCNEKAFLQVVTEARVHQVDYPLSAFCVSGRAGRSNWSLRVGDNLFSPAGVTLSVDRSDLSLKGRVLYH